MKKKPKKQAEKKYVSKEREKEIAETFKALNIVNNQPYYGADQYSKGFERVSLYKSTGFIYKTSGNSNG